MLRREKELLERSVANRYKSRGGMWPTITHGAITKPRDNSVDVVEAVEDKVDPDAYIDAE